MTAPPKRLAIIVSHPIQYYVPLYRRLARRKDLTIKVYFTWHAGDAPVHDRGFNQAVAWDIPLTDGYEFERVPNVATDPGTHHFFGLRTPALVDRVVAWSPDAVHITGWAWASHFGALRAFRRLRVPILFRGDSHLLDPPAGAPRSWVKRMVLRRVFEWPAAFLFAGTANREYYEAYGVESARLFACPHSIDVQRFADGAHELEVEASRWRRELGIAEDRPVLLYAGKFERRKRPLELMRAVASMGDSRIVLVLAGAGELERDIDAIARADPARFRVLPFQNQSRMPVVYRLGDLFVLPSAYGETWGLAVNEAIASGRPVLVSDRVGCAVDVVDPSCGRVFPWNDSSAMIAAVKDLTADRERLVSMRDAARRRSWAFDVSRTEAGVVSAMQGACTP